MVPYILEGPYNAHPEDRAESVSIDKSCSHSKRKDHSGAYASFPGRYYFIRRAFKVLEARERRQATLLTILWYIDLFCRHLSQPSTPLATTWTLQPIEQQASHTVVVQKDLLQNCHNSDTDLVRDDY